MHKHTHTHTGDVLEGGGGAEGQRRNMDHKNCEDEYKMALTLFMQPLGGTLSMRWDETGLRIIMVLGIHVVGFTFMRLPLPPPFSGSPPSMVEAVVGTPQITPHPPM